MTDLLAEIPKNMREVIRVSHETYRGHEFVSLRVWFKAGDGEFRPSKSGVSIAPDKLDRVLEALEAARSQLQGRA